MWPFDLIWAGRTGYLRLWDLCLSRSPNYGVTAFKDTSELYQRSRWDGPQEHLRAQISKKVWFGKIKDPEMIVLNFRGQLQCRMDGKRQVPIEFYPKFWILDPCWRGLVNAGLDEDLKIDKEGTGFDP